MANVALFIAGQSPQYLESVNTPDYEGNPDAIINPNIINVILVPPKYWKRSGNTITEMSAAEKQAIADAELQQRKALADRFEANMVDIFTALIKVINIRLPAGQKITKQELIDAVKLEIT